MSDERNKAAADAHSYGIGFLMILPDGTQKRLKPEDVILTDETARPTTQDTKEGG